MPVEHEWHVVVKDAAGKAVTDARVALVAEAARAGLEMPYPGIAATHKHSADGKYEPSAAIAAAEGQWFLLVTRKDSSPVVQPLAIKARKEEWLVSTRGGTASTVKLVVDSAKVKDKTVRRATFTVTLHPSAELVFIAGLDYFSKVVEHRVYAEGRMRILRKAKTIDDGTILALFSCDERALIFLVLTGSSKLLEIARKKYGPTTIAEGNVEDIQPGMDHIKDVAKDVSVLHFYKYLDKVGKDEPKRVKEAGFFSHSWKGGPLLFNTSETAPFLAVEGRDPADLDARIKDFKPANTAGWPDMKKAFADKAIFWIWGCSATRHTRRKCIEMNNKRHANGTFFETNTDEEGHGGGETVLWTDEELTPEMLRWQLDQEFRNVSYMGAAAAYFGNSVTVFGSPPGCGSNLWNDKGLEWMMINTKTYNDIYVFMKREFSPEFTSTTGPHDAGYMNYTKMMPRALMPKPPFSPRYHLFRRYRTRNWAMLELTHVDRRMPANMATYKVKRGVTVNPPAFAPAKGVLYTLVDQDDATRSKAYFYRDDQKVFEVTQDAAHKWTVLGAEI